MTNPTSNFGWQMPTSTDLVTDLPADFEVFGQAVDTSLADLKGGTTGQVLSKASNTNMDFTWVTSDDANAIQNTIVDAKGDLIGATAADTPARLAVGTNGQVLTADSTAATGLAWATPSGGTNQFFAGKNKIINGKFDVWQRGTSFTLAGSGVNNYTADRFNAQFDGTGATCTVSQQTFTPGTAPVAGYEAAFFARWNRSAAGSGNTLNYYKQPIEDVRTFAGQTVTLSFWAKADASRTLTAEIYQEFGTGGSGAVNVLSGTASVTTSWQRFTISATIPSISGKTIGTNNSLTLYFIMPTGVAFTFDYWGIQLEAGSTATDFQTATGTIQGETSACQRYLPAISGASNSVLGYAYSTTGTQIYIKFPTTARVAATGITVNGTLAANYALVNQGFTSGTPTTIAFNSAGTDYGVLNITTTAGSPTLVAGQPAQFQTLTSNGYILFTGCEL